MDRNLMAQVIILNWLGVASVAGVGGVILLAYAGHDTPPALQMGLATALGALAMACPAILPRNGNGTYPASQPAPSQDPGRQSDARPQQ